MLISREKRYHCAVCSNFDLCTKCEQANVLVTSPDGQHSAEHIMLKINVPLSEGLIEEAHGRARQMSRDPSSSSIARRSRGDGSSSSSSGGSRERGRRGGRRRRSRPDSGGRQGRNGGGKSPVFRFHEHPYGIPPSHREYRHEPPGFRPHPFRDFDGDYRRHPHSGPGGPHGAHHRGPPGHHHPHGPNHHHPFDNNNRQLLPGPSGPSGPLQVYRGEQRRPPPVRTTFDRAAESQNIHGVRCQGCDRFIVGIRWLCAMCPAHPSYNLVSAHRKQESLSKMMMLTCYNPVSALIAKSLRYLFTTLDMLLRVSFGPWSVFRLVHSRCCLSYMLVLQLRAI
jgi:hypothetical protein